MTFSKWGKKFLLPPPGTPTSGPTNQTERLPALLIAVGGVRVRLGLPEPEAAEGTLAAAAREGLAAGE